MAYHVKALVTRLSDLNLILGILGWKRTDFRKFPSLSSHSLADKHIHNT